MRRRPNSRGRSWRRFWCVRCARQSSPLTRSNRAKLLGGAARTLGIARPHPRMLGAAHPYEHAEKCGRMDEQFRQPRLVAASRRETRAALLQALFERADVVGLDEKHVQRVAAPFVKPAHRKVAVGDLRYLDAVKTRGRIKQRKHARVAEILALDRAELRRVEAEDARIAVGRGPPIADDVGDFVGPFYRADGRAFAMLRDDGAHPKRRGGVEIELSRGLLEADAALREMMRGGVWVVHRKSRAEQSGLPLRDEILDRSCPIGFENFDEARPRLHRGSPGAKRR